MSTAKINSRSLCYQCIGCSLLKIKDFEGKTDCAIFRSSGKRVWCADETVNKFNKTGRVK